jgi:hypothetical protein
VCFHNTVWAQNSRHSRHVSWGPELGWGRGWALGLRGFQDSPPMGLGASSCWPLSCPAEGIAQEALQKPVCLSCSQSLPKFLSLCTPLARPQYLVETESGLELEVVHLAFVTFHQAGLQFAFICRNSASQRRDCRPQAHTPLPEPSLGSAGGIGLVSGACWECVLLMGSLQEEGRGSSCIVTLA